MESIELIEIFFWSLNTHRIIKFVENDIKKKFII